MGEKKNSELVVGIDLGTTKICVGCFRNGSVKILENEGGRVTPAYLYFSDKNKVSVGAYAKESAQKIPENSIYEVKRLIGRKYDDLDVEKNKKYLSYNIESDNNKIVITTNQPNTKKTPTELYSEILSKVKADIDGNWGNGIDKAVISVPAFFNMAQRQATLQAAKAANFTVLKLISEPTATAYQFFLDNSKYSPGDNFLFYNLGGGCFDVVIFKKPNENFFHQIMKSKNLEMTAVNGHSHLGGHDFDNIIVDYVCRILEEQHNIINPKSNPKLLRQLRSKCEKAKESLSGLEETKLVFDGFIQNSDKPIEISLTKEQFKEMAKKLVDKTIEIVDSCLKSCQLSKTNVKEVILCGKSTLIPIIKNEISSYFGNKCLNHVLNLEDCVAEGAALHAAMLSSHPNQVINKFNIVEITPRSLGVSNNGLMDIWIEKYTKIPHKPVNRIFPKTFDLYEGERLNVLKNRYHGTFTANSLPSKFSEYKIDINGILKLKDTNQDTNLSRNKSEPDLEDSEENKQIDDFLFLLKWGEKQITDYKRKINGSTPDPCQESSNNLNNNKDELIQTAQTIASTCNNILIPRLEKINNPSNSL